MCDVVCVMWCKAETKKNKNKKNKNKKTNKIKQGMNWTAVVSTQVEGRPKKERGEGGGREKDITKTITTKCTQVHS